MDIVYVNNFVEKIVNFFLEHYLLSWVMNPLILIISIGFLFVFLFLITFTFMLIQEYLKSESSLLRKFLDSSLILALGVLITVLYSCAAYSGIENTTNIFAASNNTIYINKNNGQVINKQLEELTDHVDPYDFQRKVEAQNMSDAIIKFALNRQKENFLDRTVITGIEEEKEGIYLIYYQL